MSTSALLDRETKDRRTDRGNGGNDFSEFELIQDGRLAGGVEADHENTHFLFAKEARHCSIALISLISSQQIVERW